MEEQPDWQQTVLLCIVLGIFLGGLIFLMTKVMESNQRSLKRLKSLNSKKTELLQ
jgi:hypothetical protein